MQCPRCMKDNTTPIGDSHYVCNNPDCLNDENNRTQFKIVEDSYIRFPYNQIFVDRSVHQFYRKPYLELEEVGEKSTTR